MKVLLTEGNLLADQCRHQKDVNHEDNLRKVIPLHVPKIIGLDNKLAQTADLLFLIVFLLILILVVVHLKNFFASKPTHHAYDLDLFPYKTPMIFSTLYL